MPKYETNMNQGTYSQLIRKLKRLRGWSHEEMAEENEGKEAEKTRTRRTLFCGGCFSGAAILDTGSAILPFQGGVLAV
jgi:hypothetical protein